MRVLCAPDGFGGTLTAAEAAAAIAEGWASARPRDEVVLAPLADGGPGTVAVVAAALPEAILRTTQVADARGRATLASWLVLPDGRALVESAQACGLDGLDPGERDPAGATSYGVGQLIAAAVAAGARGVVVGLGGTATVDGGAGMATALGHRLLRADGNGVKVGARSLGEITAVQRAPVPAVPVVAAADVDSPLLGPTGAVALFAPQKGARPEDLPELEAALRRWADVVEEGPGAGPWRALPGAGAAGGLGFGLAALCGATLQPGAPLLAELVGFPAALASADLVVTGEGRLDAQTARGKVPAYVAAQARAAGIAVLAVAGAICDGAGVAFDDVEALGPHGPDEPAAAVTAAAARLARRLR